jgi:outer membrane immunogenic protein
MRRAFVACVALNALLTTVPVFAADMPLKAPPAPPPAAAWTGFYAGANGGYGWGNWNSDSIAAIFPDGVTTTADPDVKGWFGGVTAGYNWQVSPQWVLGVEGDFDWSGERASDSSSSSTSGLSPIGTGLCDIHAPCTATTTAAIGNEWEKSWFATLRARAGFLVEPTWLLYGTGGLAFAGTKFATNSNSTTTLTDSIGDIVNPNNPFAIGTPVSTSAGFSETQDRVGFAVGAGVEKLLSQDWSVKAEYLFMDFGKHTFLAGTGEDTTITLTENIVRLGVNYRFH